MTLPQAPATALDGGFADPPRQSARAFREIMEAMARPGTIRLLEGAAPPPPLSVAAATALLTLCDTDTPLHLAGAADTPDMRAWVAFHTGAPLVAPSDCTFAVGSWDALQPLGAYPVGVPEYPDRSATLIVELVELVSSGAGLRGPGIRDIAHLSLPERAAYQANRRGFPLGLDFLFTAGDRIAALPRSTEVL